MSFQGFYQVVCQQGHYTEVNCYEFSFNRWRCPDCGAAQKLAKLVDQTNDEGQKENPQVLIKQALSSKD